MKKLTSKGRDPAFIKQPDRVLWETHRSLGKEVHATGGRDATNTSPSSQLVFIFTCLVCGETFPNRLSTRVRAIDEGSEKRACPGCGAKPFGEGPAHPTPLSDELREQVVPDPLLTPVSHLSEGMRELRLWRCLDCKIDNNEEFLFSATISARTRIKNPQGCPRCSYHGPRVRAENRESYQPYLDTLVKDSSNRGYLSLVDEFPIKHNAHFQCAEGHIAYCSLELMKKKDGCVTCYANELKGTNLADPLFEYLWEEFLYAPAYLHMAPDFGMQDIPSGSGTLVVRWRCKANPIHEWLAFPYRRTRDKRGCPYCGHKRLANGESLADLFREIAAEFDSDKNLSPKTGLPLSPNTIWCRDRRQYWFLCPAGHSYKCSIAARTVHGKGCHDCEVLPSSIHELRPDLAAEWNTKKNAKHCKGLSAKNVTAGSNKKVWWSCSEAGHEWAAVVKDRAKGTGCPFCQGRPMKRAKNIAALYPQLEEAFNKGGNPKKADSTKAVLRDKYFWRCQCNKSFEKRLVDVIRRGSFCGDC